MKYASKLFSFVFKKDGKPLRNWTPTRPGGIQGKGGSSDLSNLFETNKNLQNIDNGVQEGWRDMYYIVSGNCNLLRTVKNQSFIYS